MTFPEGAVTVDGLPMAPEAPAVAPPKAPAATTRVRLSPGLTSSIMCWSCAPPPPPPPAPTTPLRPTPPLVPAPPPPPLPTSSTRTTVTPAGTVKEDVPGAVTRSVPKNSVAPVLPVAPELPVLPEAPVLPVLPVLPATPLPVAPVAPVAPVLPEGPVLPVLPVLPELPVLPALPELPVLPVLPEFPVLPVLPEAPELPVLPAFPVAPALPVLPVPPPPAPVAPVAPVLPVPPPPVPPPVGQGSGVTPCEAKKASPALRMAMTASMVGVQLAGEVNGGMDGGQLPVKTPSEHASMASTSKVDGAAAPHKASNSAAHAPARSAIPTTGGSVEEESVGAFCDAPMPARAPA